MKEFLNFLAMALGMVKIWIPAKWRSHVDAVANALKNDSISELIAAFRAMPGELRDFLSDFAQQQGLAAIAAMPLTDYDAAAYTAPPSEPKPAPAPVPTPKNSVPSADELTRRYRRFWGALLTDDEVRQAMTRLDPTVTVPVEDRPADQE